MDSLSENSAPTPMKRHVLRRIRDSVWRQPFPQNDRDRMRLALNDLILHLHAPKFPKRSLKFTYSFGLGGISIMLFMILALTGMLLLFAYTPSTDEAYGSIETLQTDVWLGQLIRNLHHWSGNLLLIVATLHFLRVFYTAAFHAPREFNWLLGLTLLVLIIFSNFTGYLLPWDQLSYWAVTIGTSMVGHIPLVGEDIRVALVGGDEVGSTTLRTFFALHIAFLPLSIIILISYHIWRVRKDEFTVPRDVDEKPLLRVEKVTTIPHLVSIEAGVGLLVFGLLLVWSILVNAPLQDAANPYAPPNPAKAAWYFMGFQELLLHFHPTFVTLVIPALAVVGSFLLPYLDSPLNPDDSVTGVWFRSKRGRWMAVASVVIGVVSTAGFVILDEFWLNLPELLEFLPNTVSNGVIPLGAWLIALWGYQRWLLWRGATPTEAAQAVFTLIFAAFVTLTVIGVYFRGANMALVFPWEL